MNCKDVAAGDFAERYVLGQLNGPERDAFEEHYYICAECFDEIRLLQAVRHVAPARRPAGQQMFWRAAAAAIVIVGMAAGWRQWRGTTSGESAGRAAQQAAVVPRDEGAARANALQLLARVDPPRYTAATLRGQSGEAERQFRAAMQRYVRGDYEAASEALKGAVAAAPDAAAPRFYLGVCELLVGRAQEAAAELARVDALGQTAYQEEARFFRSKAIVAKQDVAGAIRALELTVQLRGDREPESRRMLDQLRAMQAHQ